MCKNNRVSVRFRNYSKRTSGHERIQKLKTGKKNGVCAYTFKVPETLSLAVVTAASRSKPRADSDSCDSFDAA